MVLILHMSDDNCIEKRIILIAAEYSGFTVEFHQGCKLGLCDKAPEYLQFLAQEPFLEIHETQLDVADGTIVIGANNIARFLCKFKYTFGPGADAKLQRVFIEQFIGFSTNQVYQCASNYYNYRHKVQPPASVEESTKTKWSILNGTVIYCAKTLVLY
ncbi:hypothetical protein TSUD_277740 [Trifolium subterraneum]|uniref:Uncharacterized protein n=1 Tax=Trifolium subterraneum TaxID=3900 RepID=A0A2Z6MHZ0_TRISU|nr:hypothetical protein TSUD_277740 [Trifolium subterraneum]